MNDTKTLIIIMMFIMIKETYLVADDDCNLLLCLTAHLDRLETATQCLLPPTEGN